MSGSINYLGLLWFAWAPGLKSRPNPEQMHRLHAAGYTDDDKTAASDLNREMDGDDGVGARRREVDTRENVAAISRDGSGSWDARFSGPSSHGRVVDM